MNGVWIVPFVISTGEHVVDKHRQDEYQHIANFETTQLASTTEASKEYSIVVFINKTLVIIITKNINLTFSSSCSWFPTHLAATSMSVQVFNNTYKS